MQTPLRWFVSTLFACLAATAAIAQTAEQRAQCEREFKPQSGQAGKDVVWVPTPDSMVAEMLSAANTTSNDIVYDLGAGDGKIAIAAARDFGARAVGVEYDAKMATLAKCLVQAVGLADKVRIVQGDIFKTDFSEATVVTLYLLPSLNAQLIPTLLKMNPGTRVVSHSFLMGDWRPDRHIFGEGANRAYLWIVPAAAAGTWRLQAPDRAPLTLELTQRFQILSGVVVQSQNEMSIYDAALRGAEIAFTYAGLHGVVTFTGMVSGHRMEATVTDGQQTVRYAGHRDPR
jgi:SAM-dependent methyltransferase